MTWKFKILLLTFIFAGCGKEKIELADKIDISINFFQQNLKAKLSLKKEYQFPFSIENDLHPLSKISVLKNENSQSLWNINLFEFSKPNFMNWSEVNVEKLLSKSLYKSTALFRSLSPDYPLTSTDLIYPEVNQYLEFGSILEHSDFFDLPKSFSAVQEFKDKQGKAYAWLYLKGPSKNFRGGLLLFVNLGINPFKSNQEESFLSLESTGPIKVSETLSFTTAFDLLSKKEELEKRLEKWRR